MKVIVEVCAIGISDVHICGRVTIDLDELLKRQEQAGKYTDDMAQAYMGDLLDKWLVHNQDWKEAHLHLGHILEVIS